MLIETLGTLAAMGTGAAALRYAWRLAAAEDARRAAALESERVRWHAAIEIERARAAAPPPPPQQMTYAPHITYHAGTSSYAPHITSTHAPAAAQAIADVQGNAAPVPAFADLLASGSVGNSEGLLLGYSEGTAVIGSWLDLYSTAIGGLSGSGKSTTQRFFACQTALAGAKFVVIDPHAGAGHESLAASLSPLGAAMLCQPAGADDVILSAARMVAEIGQRRIAGDADRTPVILWVDEFTALMTRSEVGSELAALVETVAQEYRKVSVYVSLSGQVWRADRAGGTPLRDSLASVIAHRMKRAQARLLLPTEDAATCERLATGQAVLYRTSGESLIISVPNTTAADMQRVGKLLDGSRAGVTRKPVQEVGYVPSPSPTAVPANVVATCARIKAGETLHSAIQAVYGVGGGRKYTEAQGEVLAYIREVLP